MTTAHPPGSRPPAQRPPSFPAAIGLVVLFGISLVGAVAFPDRPGWWIAVALTGVMLLVAGVDYLAWRGMRDRGELRGPGEPNEHDHERDRHDDERDEQSGGS